MSAPIFTVLGSVISSSVGYLPPAANLTALGLLGGSTGDVRRVLTLRAPWVFQSAGARTVDGITVIAGVGGQWWRQNDTGDKSWSEQAAWFIDPGAGGSDENVGSTNVTALKTWAELRRRLEGQSLLQQTTVTLLASLSEYCRLKVDISDTAAPNSKLIVAGDPTALVTTFTGSGGLSAVTAISRAAGGGNRLTLTDANTALCDFTTKVGQRIRMTSGANNGAIAWVIKSTAATVALCSAMCTAVVPATTDGTTVAEVTPAINDQYVVETLPSVYGLDITVQRIAGDIAHRNLVCVVDLQLGPGSDGTSPTSQNFVTATGAPVNTATIVQCKVRGAGIMSRLQGAIWQNCCGQRTDAIAFQFGITAINAGAVISNGAATAANVGFNFAPAAGTTIRNDFMAQGGSLGIIGPVIGSTNGFAVFDAAADGVTMTGTGLGASSLLMSSTSTLFGSGNGGVGVSLDALHSVAYETNQPTITGTLGDFRLGGQILAWANAPIYEPFKMCGIVANSSTVSSVGNVKTTATVANIAATNLFASNPQSGAYRVRGYISIVTAGAGGDTISLTLTFTDTSQAETLKVPLVDQNGNVAVVASVAAKGLLYFDVMIERNSGTPQYALTFPTKTGAPSVNLRITAKREQ